MKEDRILFKILADPIKNYLTENGIDQLSASLMATEIADRQLNAVKARIEVLTPKERTAKDER